MARRKRNYSNASPNAQPNPNLPFEKRFFSNWSEFVDAAESSIGHPDSGKYNGVRPSRHYRPAFNHVNSFEEAIELARYGWPEGEKEAAKIANPIFDAVSSLIDRQTIQYDVEGMAFDIPRYLEGEPECWMNIQNQVVENSGHRIIRLVFNSSVSHSVNKRTMIAKGSAIAALIQLLEFAGNRVQLEVIPFCGQENIRYESRVMVKHADQNLDLSRLIFALAHPATLRVLALSEIEDEKTHGDMYPHKLGAAFGYPMETDDKGDIYIGRSFAGEPYWESEDATRGWIIATLKQQGVKLEEVVS